jgi:hypothetical protein
VRLFIPVNGGLSVMRGAILYGMDPSVIQQRCSRFTYGVEVTAPFRAVHDMARRYSVPLDFYTFDCLCGRQVKLIAHLNYS